MAFSEAQLVALLDPANGGRTITIERMIVGPTVTDVFAVGVTQPYAGRSRWVPVLTANTPAQAVTQIQAALTQ